MRRLVTGLILASLAFTGIAAPASAASSSPNIVDRLIQMNRETGDFDTLLVLVLCPSTGGAVIDLLDGPETRTLFAPTDAAFDRANIPFVEAIYACVVADPGLIIDTLAYHVTDGRVTFDDLKRSIGSSITMFTGLPAYITGNRSKPLIQGASIVRRNVKASNGLIQVVDLLLVPTDPCPPGIQSLVSSVGALC